MPDIILPVLNEAAAIPAVMASLPTSWNPIVVDNGSTDGSGALAHKLGAQVIHEPQPGFGAACFAGLLAARDDVVCFMDCDGSLDGADLPTVADPVIRGRADLVLGARRAVNGEKNASPLHLRLANRYLEHAVRRRIGVRLTDIGPMRAARRDALLELELKDRRFGWPLEMVIAAGHAGWRIEEVDVRYLPRMGKSKVTGTARGTLRTIRDMHGVLS